MCKLLPVQASKRSDVMEWPGDRAQREATALPFRKATATWSSDAGCLQQCHVPQSEEPRFHRVMA